MHTVAGCFTSQEEALGAIHDLEKQGVSPVTIKVIESDDSKGFEREHRSTVSAATRGAAVGLIFGLAVFGILFGIAGASLFDLRHLALFLALSR